jgi:hypothetical protein
MIVILFEGKLIQGFEKTRSVFLFFFKGDNLSVYYSSIKINKQEVKWENR